MIGFGKPSRDPLSFGSVDHKLTGCTTDCVSSVHFSPKECPMTLLGITAWDSSCSIWQVGRDARGGVTSTPAWTTTHDGPILDMSFSADGRAFFGGCTKTAVMWDLRTNQKSVVASHDLPISCLTYLSIPQVASDLLITGSWDGRLRWWDLRQPNFVKEENLGEPIFAIDAQRSVPMMVAATGRMLHVYNLQTMQKMKEKRPPDVMKFNFRCIASSPLLDGVAVGSSEGRVSFLYLEEKQGCTFKAHITTEPSQYVMHQTNFCVHHPALPILLTGGGDGKVRSWNREEKVALKILECTEKHEGEAIPVSAGDISGDGTLLAYAHSYDWALGKSGMKNQPTSVHIRELVFNG